MTMDEKAGAILRENRKMCGMTAEQLSDAVRQKCGVEISAGAIRRYERGERSIALTDAILFAVAMDINVQNLLEGLDPRNEPAGAPRHQMRQLSPVVHDILVDVATRWRGDVDALMVACAVYAALPAQYALPAIMGLMEQMTKALQSGDLKPGEVPQGLSMLEEAIGRLIVEVTPCD